MKKIIGLYVVALATYILGNNWYFVRDVSANEQTQYHVKLISFIPEWLPIILFTLVLILLINYMKEQ